MSAPPLPPLGLTSQTKMSVPIGRHIEGFRPPSSQLQSLPSANTLVQGSTSRSDENDGHVEKRRRLNLYARIVQAVGRADEGRDSFDSIVSNKVGPAKTIFQVHRNAICGVSPFFESAFQGICGEGQDHAIELPQDDPLVFQYFVLWLYSGSANAAEKVDYNMLIKLHVFGGSLGLPILQNQVMNILITNSHDLKTVVIRQLHYVYGRTTERSLLRKFFVDWCAHMGDLLVVNEANEFLYPKQFLLNLVKAQHKLIVSGKPRITNF